MKKKKVNILDEFLTYKNKSKWIRAYEANKLLDIKTNTFSVLNNTYECSFLKEVNEEGYSKNRVLFVDIGYLEAYHSKKVNVCNIALEKFYEELEKRGGRIGTLAGDISKEIGGSYQGWVQYFRSNIHKDVSSYLDFSLSKKTLEFLKWCNVDIYKLS